jgi:hypothetical protein
MRILAQRQGAIVQPHNDSRFFSFHGVFVSSWLVLKRYQIRN